MTRKLLELPYNPALKERALSTRDLDQLKADVLAGRLPQVSWICATKESCGGHLNGLQAAWQRRFTHIMPLGLQGFDGAFWKALLFQNGRAIE